MEHPWLVLEDPNARREQRPVGGPRCPARDRDVALPGEQQAHVHAALGGPHELVLSAAVRHEVGGRDEEAPLGALEEPVVQAVDLMPADAGMVGDERVSVLSARRGCAPALARPERLGQLRRARGQSAVQPNVGVPPAPRPERRPRALSVEVEAAHVRLAAVDDEELAVVAPVEPGGLAPAPPVEAADHHALSPQVALEAARERTHRARRVHHQAHSEARAGSIGEGRADAPAHLVGGVDVGLHVYAPPGPSDGRDHGVVQVVALGKEHVVARAARRPGHTLDPGVPPAPGLGIGRRAPCGPSRAGRGTRSCCSTRSTCTRGATRRTA